MQALVEHGANANAVNPDDNNPVLISTINRGILKNTKPLQKRTAFYISFLGFGEPAKLLVDKGANVNAVGQHSETALIATANTGKI